MAGIRIVVEVSGVEAVNAYLERLAGRDTTELMTNIGAVLESSTRERIEETKTSPDGAAWAANLEGTSILLRTGRHLRDSVAFIASANDVEVGSSWEFAHIHQDGAIITPKTAKRLSFVLRGRRVSARKVTIPARPFVGVSAEDEVEIQRIATDWLRLGGDAR